MGTEANKRSKALNNQGIIHLEANNNLNCSRKQVSSKKLFKRLEKRKHLEALDLIASLSYYQKRILNLFIHLAPRLKSLYFSQAWVSRIVGCGRQWANECIQLLSALGFIISKRRRFYYGWRTNIYSLNPIFFKEATAYEFYPLLPALRQFLKQTTQLENDRYIYLDLVQKRNLIVRESLQKSQKGEEDDPPSPLTSQNKENNSVLNKNLSIEAMQKRFEENKKKYFLQRYI